MQRKPRQRPPGLGFPILTRLQPAEVAALDAWRFATDPSASRPEAIRRILKETLMTKPRIKPPPLTPAELIPEPETVWWPNDGSSPHDLPPMPPGPDIPAAPPDDLPPVPERRQRGEQPAPQTFTRAELAEMGLRPRSKAAPAKVVKGRYSFRLDQTEPIAQPSENDK